MDADRWRGPELVGIAPAYLPLTGNMTMHTLTIRNMVCDRCKAAVQRLAESHALPWKRIGLGELELEHALDPGIQEALRNDLRKEGFDLVDDLAAQLVIRAKAMIIGMVHHSGLEVPKVKLSFLLSEGLHKEYSTIAALFTAVEGITIEQYFLLQRIERVKELIRYNELAFNEIAYQTGFSSAAHLSSQFKRITGMTPSSFKKMGRVERTALDRVGKEWTSGLRAAI